MKTDSDFGQCVWPNCDQPAKHMYAHLCKKHEEVQHREEIILGRTQARVTFIKELARDLYIHSKGGTVKECFRLAYLVQPEFADEEAYMYNKVSKEEREKQP